MSWTVCPHCRAKSREGKIICSNCGKSLRNKKDVRTKETPPRKKGEKK